MSTQLRERSVNDLCGLAKWHPLWLQKFATMKSFMIIYGLLGTIQAMSYMYFVVTLTTIEKRFKIPSQTTGIILSGNEISQIIFSLILSYIGGQRNRPRWIAWGVVFCGLSCYILASPHFIYGAGEDALKLTREYTNNLSKNMTNAFSLVDTGSKDSQHLCGNSNLGQNNDSLVSVIPLILIFLSQFVLGIGNTLYYSLGQTYLDDNTKKTNTPLMLATAMSLRMIGPLFGFLIGFLSLNMYIDPSKHPLIDKEDPRWLGAWWFGWIILGTLLIVFSGLIGLFPKELPKKKNKMLYNSHIPQVLRIEELQIDEGIPLSKSHSSNTALNSSSGKTLDFPPFKDFPKALTRLLRNKLLIFNNISGIFYILGASGYMVFLTKYMEVQFHKNSQTATIVVGPISIIGMITGLMGSGIIISKLKPTASKVLFWNVIVGFIYITGQFSYLFMYCHDSVKVQTNGVLNFTSECNKNCFCDNVPYSPVCHEPTDTTYFSPCHAGCTSWKSKEKIYSNCSCITFPDFTTTSKIDISSELHIHNEDTNNNYLPDNLIPVESTYSNNSTSWTTSLSTTVAISSTSSSVPPITTSNISTSTSIIATTVKPTTSKLSTTKSSFMETTESVFNDYVTDDNSKLIDTDFFDNDDIDKKGIIDEIISLSKRSVITVNDELTPGICQKGCNAIFWCFSIASMIIHWFGASGRIGNVLVNYRSVATQDKSFAQGLTLMLISLFALIPGPIIFGRIIDSTCLVWTKTLNGKGNCQLYDQTAFRVRVNTLACVLTAIGAIFDFLVWYYGRHLDLYGEREAQHLEEMKRKNKPITPLLGKKS